MTTAAAPTAPASVPVFSRAVLIAQAARRHKIGVSLALLIGAAVLAAAVYGVFALLHRTPVAPFAAMSISKLTDSGNALIAAISPDGKYIVNVVEDAGQQSLWMRQIPTNSVTQIVPAADTQYSGLMFSPDGNYIYYTRQEKDRPGLGLLYQIPVFGGTPRLIVTDVDSRISFSPDGSQFTFRRDSSEHKTSTQSQEISCPPQTGHSSTSQPGTWNSPFKTPPSWHGRRSACQSSFSLPYEMRGIGFPQRVYETICCASRIFSGHPSIIGTAR